MAKRLTDKDFEVYGVPDMPANVVFGVSRDWRARYPDDKIRPQGIPHKLKFVVRMSAEKHPEFRYEARYAPYDSTGSLTDFDVYKGDQWVGYLGYAGRNEQVRVGSHTIASKMERKRYRETKDVDQAYKLTHTFAPKSLGELLLEAQSQVRNGMDTVFREHRGKQRENSEELKPFLYEFARNNIEAVMEYVNKSSLPAVRIRDMLEQIDTLEHNYKVSRELTDSSKTTTVLVRDGVYAVEDRKKIGYENQTIYSDSDSLPPQLRRAIGLLKLLPDNTMLEAVGYKFDHDKYLISNDFLVST